MPSLAVLLGLLLAFVGIGFLVYFIHHISLSIQASSVIAAAARETITAIDQLFPQGLGEALDADEGQHQEVDGLEWRPVGAPESGYIESVDGDRLLSVATNLGTIVRMDVGIGEFVVESTALVSVAGLGELEPDAIAKLRSAYVIGRHRTVQQDAEFGVRQIVDVALKALSPGINDSTTAVMCVDYLSAVLARLGPRRMIAKYRIKDEQLCLIARGPSFPLLVAEAFDQIRHSAKDNLAVLLRMLHAIRVIADQTPSSVRQATLRDHAELIAALARRAASSPAEAANVADSVAALARLFCVGLPNAR